MLTAKRMVRGICCLNRIPECLRCSQTIDRTQRWKLLWAFLGLKDLQYPYTVNVGGVPAIRLWSWHDLTTMWVIWFGRTYRLLEGDTKVLDLGANIGAFTLLAAKDPGRKVIAVEPFPENCERLKENLEVSQCRGEVRLVESAVDVMERSLWMCTQSDIPSHSKTVLAIKPPIESVEVSTVTIPQLIDMAGGSVDFLKADIEGGEYELFDAADSGTLRKISRVAVEYHGRGGHHRLIKTFEKAGFQMAWHWCEGIRGTLEFARIG